MLTNCTTAPRRASFLSLNLTGKPVDHSTRGRQFKAGRLGDLQVINGSEILLGSPYTFTKKNVNDFDF